MPKKQKSGLYRAKVTINGQPVYLSARTVRQLEQKKAQLLTHMVTGEKPKEYTFHQLVKEWWNDIKMPSLDRTGTVKAYESIVNKWLLKRTSPLQMAQAVRRSDLQKILDESRSSCSAHRIAMIRCIMGQICRYGMEVGVMQADYSASCKINKKNTYTRKEGLSQEQVQALLAQAPNHPMIYIPVLCMYYLGLRYGQTAGLTWRDFDWDRKLVHIHQQKDSSTNTLHAPKTEAGNRYVPLPDEFVAAVYPLRQHPSAYVNQCQTRHIFDTEWVHLLADCGAARHIDGTSNHYHVSCYERDYTPHQLRHTYVTVLYEAGIDPVAASRIVGHSSYAITADVYTSLSEKKKQQDAQRIRAAFSQSCTKVAQPHT